MRAVIQIVPLALHLLDSNSHQVITGMLARWSLMHIFIHVQTAMESVSNDIINALLSFCFYGKCRLPAQGLSLKRLSRLSPGNTNKAEKRARVRDTKAFSELLQSIAA